MDKNTLTGLLIIGAILFGFTWYNSKQAAEYQREKAIQDSIALAHERLTDIPAMTPESFDDGIIEAGSPEHENADSTQAQLPEDKLLKARRGEESLYTLENELVKITLSNHGANVTGVELKTYDRFDGDPVTLISPNSAEFDLSFYVVRDYNNFQVNTSEYYFTETAEGRSAGSNSLAFRLNVDSLSYVEYVYTLPADEYMVDFKVNFVNMEEHLYPYDMLVNWRSTAPQNEKGFDNENMYSYIAYRYPGDNSVEDLGQSKSTKEKNISNRVQWIAFKQQFFSSVFIADTYFENAAVKYETFVPGSGDLKKYTASIAVPFSKQQSEYNFKFYYGPNKYSELRKYKMELQRLVPLGPKWVSWFNKGITLPVFNFFGRYIASYGLIILLLTLFVKIILLPLTYKSYLSQAKMRVLKPEMEEINARYPKQEDAMKKQQAVMEMYKKAGVSPMGGCLPMLIQLPILFALFRFFPSSIELRGQSFLWANDLSSYDSILNLPFDIPFYGDHVSLFTLLMAFTLYLTSKINMAQQAATAPQMGGMKFMMLYMMPVMMLLWFNNYSSGLSYYYTLSSLITLGQTYGFRYIVNDEKLHARMKENAKKPKKKSKWQARYEEMVKAQQQQQAQQSKGKGKK